MEVKRFLCAGGEENHVNKLYLWYLWRLKGTKKTVLINDICDACDNMMVSLNQVRLVYNIHTTLNPIMNDECYYKAGKCLVRLHSVYNIHTRLNPMMNATTQLSVVKLHNALYYIQHTRLNPIFDDECYWEMFGKGRSSPYLYFWTCIFPKCTFPNVFFLSAFLKVFFQSLFFQNVFFQNVFLKVYFCKVDPSYAYFKHCEIILSS